MSYDCVENHWYCPTPPQITSYVPSIVLSATVFAYTILACESALHTFLSVSPELTQEWYCYN